MVGRDLLKLSLGGGMHVFLKVVLVDESKYEIQLTRSNKDAINSDNSKALIGRVKICIHQGGCGHS